MRAESLYFFILLDARLEGSPAGPAGSGGGSLNATQVLSIPPSISGVMDVHSRLVQLFADGPHINERVQFLWSSFHTAVALRTEAAHVFVSVTEILSYLFPR